MNAKYRQILIILVLGAMTLSSLSVMGLLQSTERLDSNGIIIRPNPEPVIIPPSSTYIPNPPPPEPDVEIDVYSNPQCTTLLTSLKWGEIAAGETSEIQIYVKNSGDVSVYLSLATENWNSQTSKNNMHLSWNYDGSAISPNSVKGIKLILSVEEECPELSSFGFDVIIIGT